MIHIARERFQYKRNKKGKNVGVKEHRFRLAIASTNDSAHARMRLPPIRYFNRSNQCLRGCV
ncbi:hypothetical protein OUZ56_008346 [Daphnia magna]|uniref:Uncharacterized protein n=1 Tax=Daphnia magna TaxID=35525 RepID=A0ABR0ACQ0_9CRUS|nr:hypothetical protein OUZ56_008346 [Daphnia magna]